MTIPPVADRAVRRVADMVRDLIPRWRRSLTPEEQRLAIHLRGNAELLESICGIIKARMQVVASVPEPADPAACKSIVARDRELRALIATLERLYRSPVSAPEGEQPA